MTQAGWGIRLMTTQSLWSWGHTQIPQLSLVLRRSSVASKDVEDGEVQPQGPSGNRDGSMRGLWPPWQPLGPLFGTGESHLYIWAYYLLNSVQNQDLRPSWYVPLFLVRCVEHTGHPVEVWLKTMRCCQGTPESWPSYSAHPLAWATITVFSW